MSAHGWRRAVLLSVATLCLTTGCGASDPTDDVPGLQRRLEAVDAAIAEGHDAAARDALAALVAATTRAEDDGRVEADQADAILAAAARLDSLLPTATPATEEPSTEAPTTTPPTTTAPATPTTRAPSTNGHPRSGGGSSGGGTGGGGGGGGGAGGGGPGSDHGKAKGHGAKPGKGNGHH